MKFEVYTNHAAGQTPQRRWRLKARNGQIIATGGESYTQRASCLKAIKRIATTGDSTPIFIHGAPAHEQFTNAKNISESGALSQRPRRKLKRVKRAKRR